MSRKSEQVKEWRRRTKKRLVKAFGGICCVCNKEHDDMVYDFHHVDGLKKFNMGSVRGSSRSWGEIVTEARKCVMVCANCHRLIHANIVEVPKEAARFDEKYTCYDPSVYPYIRTKNGSRVYELIIKQFRPKPEYYVKNFQYHLSRRPTKAKLRTILKDNSIMATSRKFNVSHTTIGRWAKKYKLVK